MMKVYRFVNGNWISQSYPLIGQWSQGDSGSFVTTTNSIYDFVKLTNPPTSLFNGDTSYQVGIHATGGSANFKSSDNKTNINSDGFVYFQIDPS